MTAIILHPEVYALRDRIAEYRRELATLLEEHIHIKFQELPKLRYRYTELFGNLEQEIQERTLEMSERRRMVELFALKLDRGQKLDSRLIDLVLKAVYTEFSQIRERVERSGRPSKKRSAGTGWWMPDIDEPSSRNTPDGTGKNFPYNKQAETRALYRRLAKRLHPDLNDEQDPLSATYWDLAQEGYSRGDLQMLRTLTNIVQTTGTTVDRSTLELMVAEEKRLVAAIRSEQASIHEMKSSEPWTTRQKLEDEGWLKWRTEALMRELKGIDNEIAKCDRFLAPILTGRRDHTSPKIVKNILSSFVQDVYINNR